MKGKYIILLLLCLAGGAAWPQSPAPAAANGGTDYGMTFASETEVRFFLYVNGKLQNPVSTGRLSVEGLEDKPYHIRIVMDDPFEITTTRTMRPDKNRTEYAVSFNPVRERIYVSRIRNKANEESLYGTAKGGQRYSSRPAADKEKSTRLSRKERAAQAEQRGTTGKDVKSAKTPYIEE